MERNLNKELKTEKSNFVSKRNELEEFFLECIEEVKKDISKRKELQSKSSKFSHKSTAKNSMASFSNIKPKMGQFQPSDKQ